MNMTMPNKMEKLPISLIVSLMLTSMTWKLFQDLASLKILNNLKPLKIVIARPIPPDSTSGKENESTISIVDTITIEQSN